MLYSDNRKLCYQSYLIMYRVSKLYKHINILIYMCVYIYICKQPTCLYPALRDTNSSR